MKIQLSRATVKFEEFSALSDVSLRVAKSSIMALVGRSGSGKTTALRALAGLQALTSGERAVPPEAHVGLVFQELHLWPYRTILSNIAEGAIYGRRTSVADARQQARELASRLGIGNLLGRFPAEVSGGERQRAAIARAVLAQPDFLLLDEPTAALDQESASLVGSLLLELRDNDVGIVIASHDIPFVRAFSTRAAVLSCGSVVDEGETSTLLSMMLSDVSRPQQPPSQHEFT
jgi:polar amino acid transport system ATP-binding protein